MKQMLVTFFLTFNAVFSDEICFPNYEELGCYSMDAPWWSFMRPVPNPMPPDAINTQIYLYTRNNTVERRFLKLWPNIEFDDTAFSRSVPMIFVTHGFASTGNETWVNDIKDGLLSNVDANIFIVDWGCGACRLSYLQVASNARVVGEEMARVIKFLVKTYNVSLSAVHFIGHSVGAQVSSYAAKRLNGVGKITALDPAQPMFEGFDESVRLCKGDATLVEVVHTNGKPMVPWMGVGMISSYGDVDFYMNGGSDQPGCLLGRAFIKFSNIFYLAQIFVEDLATIIGCDHARAYEYYINSLKNKSCIFWGHRLTDFEYIISVLTMGRISMFLTPRNSCSIKTCLPFGYFSEKFPARGDFIVATRARAPYCVSEPKADKDMAVAMAKYRSDKVFSLAS